MIEQPIGPEKSPPSLDERGSVLLSKYAAIWVWTVLIGLSGGLTYNSAGTLGDLIQMQMLGGGRFGAGANPAGNEWTLMVNLGASAVGMLAGVASWICLYMFFTLYVVPIALLGSAPVADDRRRRGGVIFLRRSYQLLIVAVLAKVAPSLFLIALNGLNMRS